MAADDWERIVRAVRVLGFERCPYCSAEVGSVVRHMRTNHSQPDPLPDGALSVYLGFAP